MDRWGRTDPSHGRRARDYRPRIAAIVAVTTALVIAGAGLLPTSVRAATPVVAWGWGATGDGEIGNGATSPDSPTPVQTTMPSGVSFTAIAAGAAHSLAIDTAGNGWTWGGNGDGQLGTGSSTNTGCACIETPVAVSMPSGISLKAVAGGQAFSVALDTAGGAWAWGYNQEGQLGRNTTGTDQPTPAEVAMPTGVSFTAIAAGENHSVALDTHGDAWAWGYNPKGQLGDGPNTYSPVPVAVTMPSGVTFTAIAANSEGQHSLALDTAGKAWAWGYNQYGQLGEGDQTDSDVPVAVTMPAGVSFSAIAAGANFSLALDTSGRAWAWGVNNSGELGNGTETGLSANSTPGQVTMPSEVTFASIAAGNVHGLALQSTGQAWAWGSNSSGALGNGTPETADGVTPVQTTMPPGVSFTTIAAGNSFSLALGAAPATTTAPQVTTQPANQSVTAGQTATFTAAASGTPTPTVQWKVSTDGGVSFSPLTGATSGTYSFATVAGDDGNRYEAVFTNSVTSVTSSAATLTVTSAPTAPVVTTQPQNQSVTAGQTASFVAAASGSPAPTVQWEVSTDGGATFHSVFGATSTTLSISGTTVAQNGSRYRAVFTNSGGSVPTNAATLAVSQYTPVTEFAGVDVGDSNGVVNWSLVAAWGYKFGYARVGDGLLLDTQFQANWAGMKAAGLRRGAYFVFEPGTDPSAQATRFINAISGTYTTADLIPAVDVEVTGGQSAATIATELQTFVGRVGGMLGFEPIIYTSAGFWSANLANSTAYTGTPLWIVDWGAVSTPAVPANDWGGNGWMIWQTSATGSVPGISGSVDIDQINGLPTIPLAITTQPQSQTVVTGQTATFTAAASGTPAPRVQWLVSTDGGATFRQIIGATSGSYSIDATATNDGNQYEAVFTNTSASVSTTPVTTVPATLHVTTGGPAPVVTLQPQNQAVDIGGTANFTAAASGTPPPTLQWQASTNGGTTFADVAGATSVTLSISGIVATEYGNQYRAVFTNGAGSATTKVATLVSPYTAVSGPIGIDVGDSNGVVDWSLVAAWGYKFGYARVGDGLLLDTQFQANWAGMKAAGLRRGAYFVFEPGTDPSAQATRFINAISGTYTTADLIPAVDVEVTGGQSAATIATELQTFVGRVGGMLGFEPIIYTSAGFWSANLANSTAYTGTPLWIVDWGAVSTPAVPANNWGGNGWMIWQTSATGSVPGISGSVDIDQINGLPTIPLAITTQPQSQTVVTGQTATFTAAASGTPAPRVQWLVSTDGGATFRQIIGATSGSYSIDATATNDGNQYEAVFTNTSASVSTIPATLHVVGPAAPPPGAPTGSLGAPNSAVYNSAVAAAVTRQVTGATATLQAPAGALPNGTVLSVYPVTNPSAVEAQLPAGQGYAVSFAVSWRAPDGTSPTASHPLTLTINDPTIQPGDTIYLETASGLVAVNAVVTAGVAVITFSTDPMFVIGAPRPAITSPASANAATGQAFNFTVTATGSPAPTIAASGIPPWSTLTDNHDRTATLKASHPVAGVYHFTITAANGVVPNARQSFTLTVRGAQAAHFVGLPFGLCFMGHSCAVRIGASGWPPPTLSEVGSLPKGMVFTANGNGTATLLGTPARGALGIYLLTVTASNGEGPPAIQHFWLLVL